MSEVYLDNCHEDKIQRQVWFKGSGRHTTVAFGR